MFLTAYSYFDKHHNQNNSQSHSFISYHSSKNSMKEVKARTEGRNQGARIEVETLKEHCLLGCSPGLREFVALYHPVEPAPLTVGWFISHQSLIKNTTPPSFSASVRFILTGWLKSVSG